MRYWSRPNVGTLTQHEVETRLHTDPIPTKTHAGLAELAAPQRRVSQRHRTLLHLVDGRRSETQVRTMAGQAGVPLTCFADLLALGLIELRAPAATLQRDAAATQPGALTASGAGVWRDASGVDSELPASRTLPPASGFLDSATGEPVTPSSWFQTDPLEQQPADDAFERAREILLKTLRAEAPWAGSLTSLRLRRARSRADLRSLIEEVEARVNQRRRSLGATLALQQARILLTGPRGLAWVSR